MKLSTLYCCTLFLIGNPLADLLEASLDDDPSLYPGHLEPLGSKQKKEQIETLTEYPSPKDFFEKFIKPGRPFLLKNGAKNQPAFNNWNTEYMKSFPEAAHEIVDVEPNLKEIREAEGFQVSFKEFLDRYQTDDIYMVNKVPTFLQKDVLMPPPLKCNNTQSLMLDHVAWMSSGGTKSVLHSDDLDNINCLFKGSKDLLFINPNLYKSKVPIDKPNGAYSSLDVDRVDFTKYPSLREVEYIQCHMEEGDCLFIPYRWYHQVNSDANKDKLNIAVNIWFEHNPDHIPQNCEHAPNRETIDQFKFKGLRNVNNKAEGNDDESIISLFEYSLSKTKYNRANLNTFYSILKKVPGIFTKTSIENVTITQEFQELALEIFNKLNVDKDKFLKKEDFDIIFNNKEMADQIDEWLESTIRKMQDIVRAQIELSQEKEKVEENKDSEPNVDDRAKKEEL